VRIALNLKRLPYDTVPVHLSKDGGQHRQAPYAAINPQMRIPSLVLDNGHVLTQSLAIIEYLDETHPTPPLLPRDAEARARVRAVAQIIAADIHPINNSGTLNYLRREFGRDEDAIAAWVRHWVVQGFKAIEAMIEPAPYAFGAEVTLADLCLVPQIYNARRFNVAFDQFPKIAAADAACQKLETFAEAAPERQPNAE
jgi:maleylacetoacetate isomerase